jgi:Flp pilus assembly pilin Flp
MHQLDYLRTLLAVRMDRLRDGEERSAGASAIEWAIITGLIAAITLAIAVTIRNAIEGAANNIQTQ